MKLQNLIFASALTLGLVFKAHAEWPERPIKIIVPVAPGSASDVATRMVTDKLSLQLGQPVVVENRPGAGSTLGTDYGAKQPADGYSFTMGAAGPLSIAPWLRSDPLPYNPEKDFVGVAALAWGPQVLVVRKEMPVTNFRELLDYAKRAGTQMTFGTQGNGTAMHLVVSQLLHQTGMKAEHIPYQGGPQAVTGLAGGQVDFVSESVPVVQSMLASGKLKALAVSSGERIPTMPDVPTLKEQGVANFDMQGWIIMLAPAKVPDAIVRQMSKAMEAVMKMPDVRKRLNDLGLIPMDMPREKMAAFLQAESRKWQEAVRVSGAAQSVR